MIGRVFEGLSHVATNGVLYYDRGIDSELTELLFIVPNLSTKDMT